MKDFAAIDFETANNERSSVCSVGIIIVRDGKIVEKGNHRELMNKKGYYYSLVMQQYDHLSDGVLDA